MSDENPYERALAVATNTERTRCIEIVRQCMAAAAYACGTAGMPPKMAEIINDTAAIMIEGIQEGDTA
jgi:hypothetical protein